MRACYRHDVSPVITDSDNVMPGDDVLDVGSAGCQSGPSPNSVDVTTGMSASLLKGNDHHDA